MRFRHPFLGSEPLPGSVLGGIALVLTALGGVITAIAGFRRPRSSTAPTSEQVWLETLYQLDLAAQERDALQREIEHVKTESQHWHERAQAAEAEADGWEQKYEETNRELLALLRERPGHDT